MRTLALALIFLPMVEVTTGNASAKTTVTNDVSGDARVETRVMTTVNGQTTTVESDKPGTLEVSATDGSVSVQTSPEATPTVTTGPDQSTIDERNVNAFVVKIQTFLEDLFKRFGLNWPFGP